VVDRRDVCLACGGSGLEPFHHQANVPVNSCLLLASEEEATAFPTGEIRLVLCPHCGFIANTEFDPALAEYSDRYEETQAFSDRFVTFARSLARHWIDRYDLTGKTVLEIGCGKGEFLVMMAEAGIGRGIGIDPGVHPERIETAVDDRLEWIADFFTDEHPPLDVDAVVCRHTLEHIAPVGEFVQTIRDAIGDNLDTVVLFELPDVQRLLDEVAFWDIYYEHCSYFSVGSLARLFEASGFEVMDITLAYDDQYLILEARPIPPDSVPTPWPTDDIKLLRAGATQFELAFGDTLRITQTRWMHDSYLGCGIEGSLIPLDRRRRRAGSS
jgi:SAM-dependent methyltransferase